MKRARDDNTSQPPAVTGIKLPADLWAQILNFAYLDEVLNCHVASKFFINDVSPHLKHLLVRKGESLGISSAAIARFSSVEKVYVYSLIKNIDEHPDAGNLEDVDIDWLPNCFHLDIEETIEWVVPFLCGLPSLKYCFLGGLLWDSGCVRTPDIGDEIRCDITYTPLYNYDSPQYVANMMTLIHRVCRAYLCRHLADDVHFDGLLPFRIHGEECAWINYGISTYRDDVQCQICDMVCHSLPIRQVLELDDGCVPCISLPNRIRICQFRDPFEVDRERLTQTLLKRVEQIPTIAHVAYPPDYSKAGVAVSYREADYEYMEFLSLNGANTRDPSIRRALVHDREPEDEKDFINGKRLMLLEVYNKLKRIGFDINEDDFVLADSSDRRTNMLLFRLRKEKEKMDPVRAARAKERFQLALTVDLMEVQDKIKTIIDGIKPFTYYDTRAFVRGRLEDWIGEDLSEYEEAIHCMLLEAV